MWRIINYSIWNKWIFYLLVFFNIFQKQSRCLENYYEPLYRPAACRSCLIIISQTISQLHWRGENFAEILTPERLQRMFRHDLHLLSVQDSGGVWIGAKRSWKGHRIFPPFPAGISLCATCINTHNIFVGNPLGRGNLWGAGCSWRTKFSGEPEFVTKIESIRPVTMNWLFDVFFHGVSEFWGSKNSFLRLLQQNTKKIVLFCNSWFLC